MLQLICFASLMALTMVSSDTFSPVSPVSSLAFPTVSPVTSLPSPKFAPCNVCGEHMTVGFLHRAIKFPGYPEISCEAMQDGGLKGYVDPAICPVLPAVLYEPCKCIEMAPASSSVKSSTSPTWTILLALIVMTRWML